MPSFVLDLTRESAGDDVEEEVALVRVWEYGFNDALYELVVALITAL